jgi:hypothetical protein
VQTYSVGLTQGLTTLSRDRPDPIVEARLESLCEKGCRRVWGDIAALERGESLPETRDLTPPEVRWLLAELKQVMAVYGARCSAD